MRYLPINIDTKEKSILIIGGGNVAYRKCKKLLDTEFKIYIIAMAFKDKLLELADKNPDRIFIKQEEINDSFVFFGYDYLIIATNDFEINSAMEKRAQRSKVPYVRCDNRSDSTFIMSRVVTRGDIVVSISCEGNNPTVTEIIGEDISKALEKYDPEKIRVLNDIRTELVRKNTPNIDTIIRDLFFKETISLNKYLEEIDSYEENSENR